MSGVTAMIRAFLRCRTGATSIEYALIAGAIFLVIVGVVGTLGTQVDALTSGAKAGLQ